MEKTGNDNTTQRPTVTLLSSDAFTAEIGQRLRQARLARDMTQSDVASGQFSVSYVSAVERGQIRPSLGALEKLAKRLQVPVSDLLRVEGGAAPVAPPRREIATGGERNDVDTQVRSAQLLLYRGEAAEAAKELRSLRSRWLAPREKTLVAWQMAQTHIGLKETEQAVQEAEEALALAERLTDAEFTVRIRLTLAEALMLANKYRAALDQLMAARSALASADLRDPQLELQLLSMLGTAQSQLGDVDLVIETLGEAASIATDVLSPERLGSRYWSLSEHYRSQGDTRRAQAYARQSLIAYEDASAERLTVQVLSRLGRALAQVGRRAEAITLLENARAQAERRQDPPALAQVLNGLARIALQEGRVDDALRAAERAQEFASTADDPAQQAESLLVRALVLDARNDEQGAQRSFEEAISVLEGSQDFVPLSDAYAQFSDFLERRGQNARALETLKQAWRLRERAS